MTSTDLLRLQAPPLTHFRFTFTQLVPTVAPRWALYGNDRIDALSAAWLGRLQGLSAYYAGLRDKFDPGKPLWITETADTACGGNPWASTFLDTFRYLNQLGMMAHDGIQVVTHNTLDSSDYGLLHEGDYTSPELLGCRSLWRLMGTTVLQAEESPSLKPASLCSLVSEV